MHVCRAALLSAFLFAAAACTAANGGGTPSSGGVGGSAGDGSMDAAITNDGAAGSGGSGTDAATLDSALHDASSLGDATTLSDGSTEPDAELPSNPVADLAYDSFTALFYTVEEGKGYYVNNSGTATADHWWTQAELIEMAIDAYDRKPSAAYETLMTELVYGFVDVQGTDWTYNEFNDDIAWMVIASARAHLNTGNADFLAYAKSNWDAMYARAWDTSFAGGGLWWKTDNQSKNACINGPGAIGAYLLYKATGEPAYLEKAIEIYAWLRGALFDADTGAVYDNVQLDGGGDDWTFTYNSGTFIGIANYLFQETGEPAYFDDAKLAADFFKDELSDSDGLIDEHAISGDGAAFKAIGLRWVARFVADNDLEAIYMPWLQYNANRAWANRRAGDNISWNDWRAATPHMLLDSVGAAATVQILQVVPAGGDAFAWYNSEPQDGRSTIEAELCDEKRGMILEASEDGGEQLGGVVAGAWARYGQVDFTASAPTGFVARASADGSAGGDIEIRIDSLDGPLLGTCAISSTGGWTTYADFPTTLTPTTGTHDIYLVFKPTGGHEHVGNLNWFRLM
jgi:hypothetical protein